MNNKKINIFSVFDIFKDKLRLQPKTKEEFMLEFEKAKLIDDTMTAEDIANIQAMIDAKFPSE